MIIFFFFFFNDTATTEIYTLSLHDALPISAELGQDSWQERLAGLRLAQAVRRPRLDSRDRKSTRLNSSHLVISYAVFCLKKKKIKHITFMRIYAYYSEPSALVLVHVVPHVT